MGVKVEGGGAEEIVGFHELRADELVLLFDVRHVEGEVHGVVVENGLHLAVNIGQDMQALQLLLAVLGGVTGFFGF